MKKSGRIRIAVGALLFAVSLGAGASSASADVFDGNDELLTGFLKPREPWPKPPKAPDGYVYVLVDIVEDCVPLEPQNGWTREICTYRPVWELRKKTR